MNLTPPVRLSLALCVALFAMGVYFLQPDSKEVSGSEPAAVRPVTSILASSPATAADSLPESLAPSGSLRARIGSPSFPAAENHPSSAAAFPSETRNASQRTETYPALTPRDISDEAKAASAPRSPAPVASALGTFASSVGVAPTVQAAFSGKEAAAALPAAKLPTVFVEPDAAAPLTETQAAAVKVLQNEFIDAIGGPDQDPTDPEYFRRWETAKWESDQRFKSLFGVQAFLERERAGNMAGAGPQAK